VFSRRVWSSVGPSAAAQTPPASTDFPHTSGSLNLVLANKNGFVIAADSRGTQHTRDGDLYRDEYQKLFRTGPRSALAIAGLLAGGAKPFELETIARILRRFGPAGLNDGRGEVGMVHDWLELEFSHQLQRLAAVWATFPDFGEQDLRLIATVVGFDAEANVIVDQVQFVPDGLLMGNIPAIKPVSLPKIVVRDFDWRAAGMPSIAADILHGRLIVPTSAVADYLERMKEKRLASASLEELRRLTEVVFQQTMSHEPRVGGPIQMAVIPREGSGQWNLISNRPLMTALGAQASWSARRIRS
jgi:hypothetical protein